MLFTAAGLVLEHNKTELFHFTRARDGVNPSLDLGVAPYTGDTPLAPKTYWRYLGFFFDRKLQFKEHVRFYSTKALTTMKAMSMLGNSSRGLSPIFFFFFFKSGPCAPIYYTVLVHNPCHLHTCT